MFNDEMLTGISRQDSQREEIRVVEQLEQLELTFERIMALNKMLRTVMIMQYILGYNQTEIAEKFGLSRARVCQLNHQGLEIIRKKLGLS